jgi:hypothetical protein
LGPRIPRNPAQTRQNSSNATANHIGPVPARNRGPARYFSQSVASGWPGPAPSTTYTVNGWITAMKSSAGSPSRRRRSRRNPAVPRRATVEGTKAPARKNIRPMKNAWRWPCHTKNGILVAIPGSGSTIRYQLPTWL